MTSGVSTEVRAGKPAAGRRLKRVGSHWRSSRRSTSVGLWGTLIRQRLATRL